MIHERWRAVAADNDDVAVVVGEREVRYRELLRLEASLAETLEVRAGVGPGDVVLAPLPSGLELILAFLACARLGAVLAPLSSELRDPEVAHYLDRLDVQAVLTTPPMAARWPTLVKRMAAERRVVADTHRLEPWVGSASTSRCAVRERGPFEGELVYLSTSGSTGTPKIVARSHAGELASLDGSPGWLDVNRDDRVLGAVPLHHAYGLSKCVLLSLLNGACLVLMHRFLPRHMIDIVARRRVTAIVGSPLVFSALAECGGDPAAFASVHLCLSAGAALPEAVQRDFLRVSGLRIRQLYGSSEASTMAIQDAGGDRPRYRPLGHVEVRIVDGSGVPVAPGELGEVTVRSPAMALGYVVDREGGLDRFGDGYRPTGDLGRLDAAGLLVLEGRKREHLNIAGVKVDPVELETVLRALDGVVDVQVVAIEGPRGLDVIKAALVVSPRAGLTRERVVEHCRSRLAEYKLPRVIEITATA